MNHFLKLIALAISTFACSNMTSAQSRISIRAADSLDFIIYAADVKVNNYPCINITFDQPGEGKILFKAEFPHRPQYNFSQTLQLKKYGSNFYEIEKSKGVYKFVLKSESVLAPEAVIPAVAAETTDAALQTTDTAIAADSSTSDANAAGCHPLVSQELYESMLSNVNDSFFETRKLEVMQNFVGQSCVRVEQLRYMLSRLALEDNKILLLKSSLGHLTDPENIKRISEDFFLEKNKARVNEMISAGQTN